MKRFTFISGIVFIVLFGVISTFIFPATTAEPDFSLTLDPTSVSIEQGSSASINISVTEQDLSNPGGSLLAVLSSDTPTFSIVVPRASLVPFTQIDLTAFNNDITIDHMTIQRSGISYDANFIDLVILDADTRFPISDLVPLNNDHRAMFETNIFIPEGSTRSIILAGNIASTPNATEMASLNLVDIHLTNDSTLSGNLPIIGNQLMMNGSVNIGSITVSGGSLNPAWSVQPIGTQDYIFSSVKITASSREDVQLELIRFYNNGNAADTDVVDLELLHDGVVIATLPSMNNNELIFDLSDNPIDINRGTAHEFSLRGDIVGGLSHSISFDIEEKADVILRGLEFGFYILPVYPNTQSPMFNANDTVIDASVSDNGSNLISQMVSPISFNDFFGTRNAHAGMPVLFSVVGLPTDASASFSPSDSCDPDCTSTLHIQTSPTTPPGSHLITITGTRSNIQKQVVLNLIIVSPPADNNETPDDNQDNQNNQDTESGDSSSEHSRMRILNSSLRSR